jgi:hypothetical protein
VKIVFKKADEEGMLWETAALDGHVVHEGDIVFLPGGHECAVVERHVDLTGAEPTMTVLVELDDG